MYSSIKRRVPEGLRSYVISYFIIGNFVYYSKINSMVPMFVSKLLMFFWLYLVLNWYLMKINKFQRSCNFKKCHFILLEGFCLFLKIHSMFIIFVSKLWEFLWHKILQALNPVYPSITNELWKGCRNFRFIVK